MKDVIRKLRFPGHENVLVLNTPAECVSILNELENDTDLHTSVSKKTIYPAALAFVHSVASLNKMIPGMIGQLGEDAVFWIAFPKKSSKKYKSDINRDEGWQILGDAGFETVSSIAIDKDWSALRFRKAEKVKKMIRRQAIAISDSGKEKTINKSGKAVKTPGNAKGKK